jgi:hypothetical protein
MFFLLNALLVLAQQFIEALSLKQNIDSYLKWIRSHTNFPDALYVFVLPQSFYVSTIRHEFWNSNFA